MKRLTLGLVAVAAAMIGVVALAPAAPVAAQSTGGVTLPCTPLGANIQLVCNITSFADTNGVLTASGTVTNPAAPNLPPLSFTNVPVQNLTSGPGNSCRILSLTLGPIDLNLLGLRVQTDQIVVNITAERGPGNLLGNLLCAVAGLFDNQAPTNLLAGLLNFILGRL